MKDFLTELVIKMMIYCVAVFIATESIGLFGDGFWTNPQFNWIALIFVAIVSEIWGMHKGKMLTLRALKKAKPSEGDTRENDD